MTSSYRFNNFKNLKSDFYPSDKQVKIFNETGKVARRNCNGPWAGYSTEKALKDRATLINSISESTMHNRRKISPTPWKRANDPKVKSFVSKEITPKWTKISVAPESKYDQWQNSRLIKRGANYAKPFFKNRLSASTPNFMHIPRLAPEEFKRREKQNHDEYLSKTSHIKSDFGVSWEAPDFFHTDTNGIGPDRSHKRLTYAGRRTLLKLKTPKNAPTCTTLKLLENRTSRRNAVKQGPHNMRKTEITEFVNACVKQRVQIWKS